MRFFTTLKLGPNREVTREGFTLFRNVSVSRTGVQVYGPDEGTGIEPGPDGLIYITRTPEEIFRPETLASGNGKSLVVLHPDDDPGQEFDVRPDNWRDVTHGIMFDLRRGTGDQSDESVADVMIYTPEAMREIDLGMRELSLGYLADYFHTARGHGEQRNIYVNHVALVPSGRCGTRCAISDHAPIWDEVEAHRNRTSRFVDACRARRKGRDDAELQIALGGHGADEPSAKTEDPFASTTSTCMVGAVERFNRERFTRGRRPIQEPTADELERMTPTQRFVAKARDRRQRWRQG